MYSNKTLSLVMDIKVDTTGKYGSVFDWNISYLFEVKD